MFDFVDPDGIQLEFVFTDYEKVQRSPIFGDLVAPR
jgi:hypothetical protein